MGNPEKAGLWDPDAWREWWLDLHPSNFFDGYLARLAVSKLEDETAVGNTGVEALRYVEDDETFEVEVGYLIEDYPNVGRVFFVLSIKSEGDPLPPWVER